MTAERQNGEGIEDSEGADPTADVLGTATKLTGDGKPTGEGQAAINRENDSPA